MKKILALIALLFLFYPYSYSQSEQKIVNNSSSFWTLSLNDQVLNIEPYSIYSLTNNKEKSKLRFYALEMILNDGHPYIKKHGFVLITVNNDNFDLKKIERIPIYLINSSHDVFVEHLDQAYFIPPFETRHIKDALLNSDSIMEIRIYLLNNNGEVIETLKEEHKVKLANDKGYIYLPCF